MKLKGRGLNIERLSIKWKWSLIISATIIFVYLIFAMLVYYSTQQVVLDKESQEIEIAMGNAEEVLKPLQEEVTEENIEDLVKDQQVAVNTFRDRYDQADSRSGDREGAISKLSLRLFDLDGKEVYAIGANDYPFQVTNKFILRPVSDDPNFSLMGVKPLVSETSQERIGYIQIINNLASFHHVISQIISSIFFIGLLVVVLSVFLGLFISDRFLSPIRRLKNAMAGIIKEPESEKRLKVAGSDELAELASIYNQMIDRMQKNIDSQKQFVEDVSHELRTPVAIVEGHLNLLERWGKDDPEILEESIQASVQEISRMKSLVQEMLDLSRAVQVDIQYKDERTDVKQLVSQLHNNFQLVHEDFTFNLDIDVEGEAIVNMYRNHLEQVLIILLDNAVKYSKDRKEVHLSLATSGDRVQIAVQDFGEGISEEDSQKIFNRFYRVDKARSREKGGNGLGLSIAKQLINGYGGTISVDSVPGRGSVFRIELKLLQDQAKDQDSTDSKGQKKE